MFAGHSLMHPLANGVATIFTLHRFRETSSGPGHPVSVLRQQLAHLRGTRYRIISLTQLLDELSEHQRLPPTVVFTVDDGYADFARVGAPIFAEFDCPVTVFLATGFIDGSLWLWWDRVRCAFERSPRRTLNLTLDSSPLSYQWGTLCEAAACASDLANRLEHVDNATRQAIIDALPSALDADVPPLPTPEYSPMSWTEIRTLGQSGAVTFGPHTVSHPILSRITGDAVAFEIRESWQRVRAETAASTPIFCYPNGQHFAVGEREHAAVAESGLVAAVSSSPSYARVAPRDSAAWRYRVPRFGCPEDHAAFRSIVSGVERLKAPFRRVIRR